MREWVEANPGRVDGQDKHGHTALCVAVSKFKSVPLKVWLIDGRHVLAEQAGLHAGVQFGDLSVKMKEGKIGETGRIRTDTQYRPPYAPAAKRGIAPSRP